MWLQGYGKEADRPDKSGVLIDQVLPIKNSIQCKPLWKGAAYSAKGMLAIEHISRDSDMPALVAGFPETHMVRVIGRGIK